MGCSAIVERKSTHPLPLTGSCGPKFHTYIHTYIHTGRWVSLTSGTAADCAWQVYCYAYLVVNCKCHLRAWRPCLAELDGPSFGKPWLTFIEWPWQYLNCQVSANLPCVSQVWQTSKPGNGLLHFTLAGWIVPTHLICSLGCKVWQEQRDDHTVYKCLCRSP